MQTYAKVDVSLLVFHVRIAITNNHDDANEPDCYRKREVEVVLILDKLRPS